MRGALVSALMLFLQKRIIPADAGSTEFADIPHGGLTDHPRGCGEHRLLQGLDMMGVGSSPRMRGARAWLEIRTL